jgi:hypothetical protein
MAKIILGNKYKRKFTYKYYLDNFIDVLSKYNNWSSIYCLN